MHFDDATRDGEAEAGSARSCGEKWLENGLFFAAGNTGSVVAYGELDGVTDGAQAHLDRHVCRRRLVRVLHQVHDHLLEIEADRD